MDRAFEEFAAARLPALLGYARALTAGSGGGRDAEDLVQEALARTGAAWWRVRRHDDPEGYVRRTMLRLAINRWRRPRREVSVGRAAGARRRGPRHAAGGVRPRGRRPAALAAAADAGGPGAAVRGRAVRRGDRRPARHRRPGRCAARRTGRWRTSGPGSRRGAPPWRPGGRPARDDGHDDGHDDDGGGSWTPLSRWWRGGWSRWTADRRAVPEVLERALRAGEHRRRRRRVLGGLASGTGTVAVVLAAVVVGSGVGGREGPVDLPAPVPLQDSTLRTELAVLLGSTTAERGPPRARLVRLPRLRPGARRHPVRRRAALRPQLVRHLGRRADGRRADRPDRVVRGRATSRRWSAATGRPG